MAAPRDTTTIVLAKSTSGDQTLVTGVTAKKIKVVSLVMMANAVVNVKFKDSTPQDLTGLFYFSAKGGVVLNNHEDDWFETAAGKSLVWNLSASQAVGGVLTYIVEA